MEGLIAVVGLEEGIRTGRDTERQGSEFQILGAATLKLRVPIRVRTNGAERRLVSEVVSGLC